MCLEGAIQLRTKGRRTAIFAGKVAAILSAAVILSLAHTPLNVPGDLTITGAPGDASNGCASCHGTLTTPSAITLTGAPSSYTVGGPTVAMTIGIPASGQMSLTALTAPTAPTPSVAAGTLAAGPPPAGGSFPNDAVTTVNSRQYVYSTVDSTSATATSFNINWTPPTSNVGDVVLYVAAGNHNTNYVSSFKITAPSTTPPPPPTPTITVSPTSLTFNVSSGTVTPTSATISVTSSGAPIPYTTSFSTTNCGSSWLNAVPPGASTPTSVTVSINGASSLPSGTCTGSVVITPAAGSASDGAQTVSVTANVTTPPPPPPPPTLNLSSTGLTFTATAGGTAPSAQSVMVTTSNGSSVTFNAAPTSTGSWLTVGGSTGTSTGTTAASESVGVVLTGLAAGTYNGSVTFTSSAVSNSPQTLPVTLTINPSTTPPPPPPPSTTTTYGYNLLVVDRQSGGQDWILLNGSGGVNSTGQLSGGGVFTRFSSTPGTTTTFGRSGSRTGTGATGTGGTGTNYVVATGRWKATSASFTGPPITSPAGCTLGGTAPCRISGGTLVVQVQLTTQGCGGTSPSPSCSTTPTTGTLTIISTGSNSGVTLNAGAWNFLSAGIGTESIGNGGDD